MMKRYTAGSFFVGNKVVNRVIFKNQETGKCYITYKSKYIEVIKENGWKIK